MGGSGGGIAYNKDEFVEPSASAAWRLSARLTRMLIEESLIGWKEFEMEVVRDKKDNCIIVCSIENFDPMGVHTGDSITVAPAQTLTDKEYQIMRDASLAVLREIGVETGGSNVQFAIRTRRTGRMVDHRNESPGFTFLGPGFQGDRLPHCQGGGKTGGRLYARRTG
jgi:carbamoyl-phosphate synthase large subunit